MADCNCNGFFEMKQFGEWLRPEAMVTLAFCSLWINDVENFFLGMTTMTTMALSQSKKHLSQTYPGLF